MPHRAPEAPNGAGLASAALVRLPGDVRLQDITRRFPHRFAKGVPSLKPDAARDAESKKSWWASLDEIRKNNYDLIAGLYCPHQAEAQEHEPPEVPTNRLLDLRREIQSDLEELLDPISSPKEDQAQEAHA